MLIMFFRLSLTVYGAKSGTGQHIKAFYLHLPIKHLDLASSFINLSPNLDKMQHKNISAVYIEKYFPVDYIHLLLIIIRVLTSIIDIMTSKIQFLSKELSLELFGLQ